MAAMAGLDPGGRWAVRLGVDRKPCSCPACGNPRKWTGEPTRAERMAEGA